MKLKKQSSPIGLNNKGFSLAEIMIVLVIIGGIMAIILPKIREGQINSKIRQTKMKMSEIENKLNEYEADCGKLPSNLEFMVKDVPECKNWTSNKLSKNLLKDEWNKEFVYEVTGDGYNLISYGNDKKEGGEGPDKDIYSEGSAANQ